jgi:predicted ATP pyrophosphatase (TIGR00289 family)
MHVAVLATGGKDSILALYHVLQEGHKVKYLATMIPQREDSWMFHYPNIELIDLVAEAAGIPLAKAATSGIKEEELKDLERLIRTLDVEGVVSGAIASTYQKTRLDQMCTQLGLKTIAPLWQREPLDLLNEILRLGFEIIVVGVYAYGFDEDWLGRRIDEATVADLINLNKKHGVSLVGEGGEYETLVLDAPIFKKKIEVAEAQRIWKDESGYLKITQAILRDKKPPG